MEYGFLMFFLRFCYNFSGVYDLNHLTSCGCPQGPFCIMSLPLPAAMRLAVCAFKRMVACLGFLSMAHALQLLVNAGDWDLPEHQSRGAEGCGFAVLIYKSSLRRSKLGKHDGVYRCSIAR